MNNVVNKIVIAGGSYNPPHKAHRKIIETLTHMFDRVIIVPCGVRPDKSSANIIPLQHRREMVKIAFRNMNRVILDMYDFENDTYTPTCFLQERYERMYPNNEIWHLVGEDIVKDIKSWEPRGEEIWQDLNWLIIRRDGYKSSEEFPPNCYILDDEDIICSGTLVRKRIADNKPIDDLVEPEIEKYIKENNLYRSDIMTKTKKICDDPEATKLVREVNHIKDRMSVFKYPEEVFGELEGDATDEKMESLKEKFRELMFGYGADRYSHYNCQKLTDVLSEVSRKIIEFEKLAEKAINDGTYGTKKSNGDGFIITSDKHEYQISTLESQADFSQTYLATYKDDKNNNQVEHVCIKMARIADDDNILFDSDEIESNNNLISHEIETLKHLDTIKDATFQKVRRQHFPVLIDDFMSASGYVDVDTERRAMVTKHVAAYDFVSLREKFPDGVPLFHACWMLARILSATGHLHFNNIIHGNIHPEGLFVNSQDHNVTIADFEFSIIEYNKNGVKYTGVTEYYTAPEVYKNKSAPHPRADIHSIGMSMIYILGGDIEKRTLPDKFVMTDGIKILDERAVEGIRSLILSMANQHELARSDDCWKSYHQLDELRKRAFGRPGFVEFVV